MLGVALWLLDFVIRAIRKRAIGTKKPVIVNDGKGPRYLKPPFMTGHDTLMFTINEDMVKGRVAGSRLVRVAVDDEGLDGTSRWLTTLDQITNPDGHFKSREDIFQSLGLPRVPTRYAFVNKLTRGSRFIVGVASDMSPCGWGRGGCLHYVLLEGSYTLERSLPLP